MDETEELKVTCPLCGRGALVRWNDRETLCGHLREEAGAREAWAVPVCEASGLALADAAAIRAIRAAGGERLRLAAHP